MDLDHQSNSSLIVREFLLMFLKPNHFPTYLEKQSKSAWPIPKETTTYSCNYFSIDICLGVLISAKPYEALFLIS